MFLDDKNLPVDPWRKAPELLGLNGFMYFANSTPKSIIKKQPKDMLIMQVISN